MLSKSIILTEVRNILQAKVQKLEELVASARASNNDTKSSMGDKYETSREMLQQEINRLLSQLTEAQNQMQSIQRLTGEASSEIKSDALFKTEKGLFYVSAALGEIIVEGQKFYAVSPESPLVKALYGKKVKERAGFGNQMFTIEEIW